MSVGSVARCGWRQGYLCAGGRVLARTPATAAGTIDLVRGIVGLLVGVLLFGGCSSDDATLPEAVSDVQGVPVLDGAAQPAGTTLGNGFTVAPGSYLIGAVFPMGVAVVRDGEPLQDRGWQARLLVVGEPAAVIAHYQRQGRAAGLEIEGGDFPRRNAWDAGEANLCGKDPVEGYGCYAYGETTDESRVRRFTFRFARRAARPVLGARDAPQSFALVAYSDTDVSVLPAGGRRTRPSTPGPPAPPMPSGWPAPGGPGERVVVGLPDRLSVRIEPGSRAAAPPLFSLDRAVPVPELVLRIDDDPERVLRAYRDQFDRLLERYWRTQVNTPPIERTRDDGASVLHLHIGETLSFDLTAFVREGQPTWALLYVNLET